MTRTLCAAVVIVAGVASAPGVFAQSGANVAVVVNENSPESVRIGDAYARARALPPSQVLRIRTSLDRTINRETFAGTIDEPLAVAIASAGLQDRLVYLVLTKGVPLQVVGTAGLTGTAASVDAELTLLYRRMTGQPVKTAGPLPNPYFLSAGTEARPFTHRDHDIYLVSRLDGATVEDALALIDRGAAPASAGVFLLQPRRAPAGDLPNHWLDQAAAALRARGHEVVFALPDTPADYTSNVLGYYAQRFRDVVFAPGAVAATHGAPGPETFGSLVRQGATGAAVHLSDPSVGGLLRPQILFDAYLAGHTLIDAFYLSMPYLSWQTVVLGDPLCAPFRHDQAPAADLDPGIDPATEFPQFFGARRLVTMRALGIHPEAAAAAVRAEARYARGDEAGARRALEEAVSLAPGFVDAYLDLALRHDEVSHHQAATLPYRWVLELEPDNVVALNNLAYDLATHHNAPEEARPLAERAFALAPGEPRVQDTLAWIRYLLGDADTAAELLAKAIQGAPGDVEIRLHAAFVHHARGDRGAAAIELAEVLRRNPALARRSDVQALHAALGARR